MKMIFAGLCVQPNMDPYEMVLYVESTGENPINVQTWYPSLGSGLLSGKGEYDSDSGEINFAENALVFCSTKGPGLDVVPGSSYECRIKGDVLTGIYTYVFEDSESKEQGSITLKRV